MWAALEAHKPAPNHADAWETMCREIFLCLFYALLFYNS
jgi:hypothetical protein